MYISCSREPGNEVARDPSRMGPITTPTSHILLLSSSNPIYDVREHSEFQDLGPKAYSPAMLESYTLAGE